MAHSSKSPSALVLLDKHSFEIDVEEDEPDHLSSSHHHIIDIHPSTISYPFVLSFNNLSYKVKTNRKAGQFCSQDQIKTKVLLDDITGEARDGEIMAIMGASGAGKSTLLDALAGRIERESLKGSVSLNGESLLESKFFKVISAYVMQDDLLFPMLTVEETLMFSAEFRLHRSVTKAKKRARVQALIDQLGLRSAAKTIIGDEQHRGISGGERRRVSIGIDIVHDPILLFLDEPTSGLDSTSAFMVVKVLQRIAKSGSIVIMSLHQPSYRILGLLDQVFFLSKGETMYNGKLACLSPFFAEFGRPIPENENQTEFALDLIRELEASPGGISSLAEFNKSWQAKKIRDEVHYQQNFSLEDAIKESIARGKLVSASNGTNIKNSSVQKFANPFWIEVIVIAKRLLLNSRRMPELFVIRLGTVLVTGLILATLYWQLSDSPKGTRGRLGFFVFAMNTIFYICAREIPAFLHERFIFIREISYNTYRHSSYLLAHSLISIPPLITLSLALSLTTFWAVGLAGGFSGFLFFLVITFASFWTGSSFMAFISGLVSHVLIGFTVAVSVLGYCLLFSGFYISREQIPSYWIWFHYLSLVKYPYQGVVQNEYGDETKCFVRGVQFFDNTPYMKFSDSMKLKLLESMSNVVGTNITSSTCLSTGVEVLETLEVSDVSKWNCLWITLAFGLLFRVLFYFTLLLGSKNKRK
ncbi:hypothetical protein Patl1_05729 [Pistacia atlantica]|uniref:Uncharacterized protein n=1 Tax=Pistacia atlantica TaxID=434234 RepID=A0ACC1BS55_9ROSI|nr:hypothetical protein Patl1_05729 [Pistacia atlantica]